MYPSSRRIQHDGSAADASTRSRTPTQEAIRLDAALPARRERRGRVVAGRFDLLELLGRGAMGEVWRARDRTLRIDVAIKFLAPSGDAEALLALERFRFEAQVAAQLATKAPGIVAVYDVGEDENEGCYLVMEYVRGRTLLQEISDRGPMTPAQFAPLLAQIAKALSLVHRLGIVHRDIKPSNVLIEAAEGPPRVKIADFGIAKGICPALGLDLPRPTASELVLGTPPYMSPELCCESRVDPQADMWALAVVTYEALTGQKPFPGRTIGDVIASIVTGALRPPSALSSNVPPALDPWFTRAFALDPGDRFSCAEEMLAAYRVALGAPPSPARKARASSGSRAKVASVAGALLAATALTSYFAVLHGRDDAPGSGQQPESIALAGAAISEAGITLAGQLLRPSKPIDRAAAFAPPAPVSPASVPASEAPRSPAHPPRRPRSAGSLKSDVF